MKKRFFSAVLAIAMLFGFAQMAFAVETPYEDSLFYTHGDYEIHYRIVKHSGEYKGRILMLHGFLCSTYAWRNMAAEMAKAGYDCVLADLPNFGYSTRETPNTKHIDRETLMEGLMDSVAPNGDWIVAGHSMGGGVALNIAEEYPVKALLLYCPAVQSTVPDCLDGVVTSAPMRFLMNTFFKIGTRCKPVVKLVVYAATMNWDFAKAYDVSGVTDPFLYDGIGGGMCCMLTTVRQTNMADAGKVKAPVLLVEADMDIILDKGSKQAFAEAFPTATQYTVQGGGHQCIEDRAAELAEQTLQFLK